jgi:outer membrane lipopolysaccharide assembly protein LptE/RlpB
MQLSKVMFLIMMLCLISGLPVLSCCGYSTRSLMPEYMQKIHIGLFQNRTLKTGLDEIATDAVIEAFRSGSNLRIVDESGADLVLEGSVSGYSKDPYTYTSDQTILEYKITVRYSARCVDRARNEVFWEGDVSDWALFSTDEEQSIREAAKKAAEKLVTNILTNW